MRAVSGSTRNTTSLESSNRLLNDSATFCAMVGQSWGDVATANAHEGVGDDSASRCACSFFIKWRGRLLKLFLARCPVASPPLTRSRNSFMPEKVTRRSEDYSQWYLDI